MNTTNDKFRKIRPFLGPEVEFVISKLKDNTTIKKVFESLGMNMTFDQLKTILSNCHTVNDFKLKVSSNIVRHIAKKTCFSLDASGRSKLNNNEGYTYISNHRDIILDSAFINIVLDDRNKNMPEIAIGDNLLIYPWIESLVKLNGSFLVRRNLSGRDVLLAAKELSEYMNENIRQGKSQWIAQREGRAKDSDDRTQPALIKMLTIGGTKKSFIENIRSLNIIPTTCSYEYDPCDYLKAKEMQLKRDIPSYSKTPEDDKINMVVGLNGYKGRVHITFGKPINSLLIDNNIDKSKAPKYIASIIDNVIHQGYRIYPSNYIAKDLLCGSDENRDSYSTKEKELFEQYINDQIKKISFSENIVKDENFLRNCILKMYANPLNNYNLSLK